MKWGQILTLLFKWTTVNVSDKEDILYCGITPFSILCPCFQSAYSILHRQIIVTHTRESTCMHIFINSLLQLPIQNGTVALLLFLCITMFIKEHLYGIEVYRGKRDIIRRVDYTYGLTLYTI